MFEHKPVGVPVALEIDFDPVSFAPDAGEHGVNGNGFEDWEGVAWPSAEVQAGSSSDLKERRRTHPSGRGQNTACRKLAEVAKARIEDARVIVKSADLGRLIKIPLEERKISCPQRLFCTRLLCTGGEPD